MSFSMDEAGSDCCGHNSQGANITESPTEKETSFVKEIIVVALIGLVLYGDYKFFGLFF